MKKLLIILMLTAGGFSETFSQSVGIGTTTPNANAILDITSTTKGFLLPRMTQAQRILISSPVNGLLVYDVTTERLYQYQDAVWRALINNSYWAKPTDGRDRMYNTVDSIGIGTQAPTEKLHVVGNIRASEKINAGAVIEGVGLRSLGSLYVQENSTLQGAVTGTSSATFGGGITTYTGVTINDAAGTLTYANGGVDKGFVQLSGNNLRMGTNSSNTDGKLVIRTQGQDRVNVNEEGITLVNNGKVQRTATGNNDLIPACYGRVRFDGFKQGGTPNFTVVRIAEGHYEIHSPDLGVSSVIVATPIISLVAIMVTTDFIISGKTRVKTYTSGGFEYDCSFSFMVYNQ